MKNGIGISNSPLGLALRTGRAAALEFKQMFRVGMCRAILLSTLYEPI